MSQFLIHTSDRAFERSLDIDKRDVSLFRKAIDTYSWGFIRAHPLAKDLRDCTNAMRKEVLMLSEKWTTQQPHLEYLKKRILEPMTGRFINRIYSDISILPSKITLLVQDLGGFGDLIFGVRELKALQKELPNMQLRMLTNGASKLQQVMDSVPCPIVEYDPNFNGSNAEAHALLRDSDLILASPTIPGSYLLPDDTEDRAITLIEYNRPDYGLDVRKNHYMTGIGCSTLGIFLDDEMRTFADTNFPLKPKQKAQLLKSLENRELYDLLHVLGISKRLYFGYGNNSMDRFLEVLVRFEARQDDKDAIILALTNSSYEDSLKKKLHGDLPSGVQRIVIHQFPNQMSVFRVLHKEGIALDPNSLALCEEDLIKNKAESDRGWVKKHYEKELSELHEMMEQTKNSANSNPLSTFHESLVSGLFFTEHGAIKSCLLAEQRRPGKTIHIMEMRKSLSFHDSHIMKKTSEDICLSTGDQSFSEDISLGKVLMYDLRKREPVAALWELAKQNQLPLASEFFRSFVENKIDDVVHCLLKKTELRVEIKRLYAIIYKDMDLTPELLALVRRKLSKLDSTKENVIHQLFEDYFLSPRPYKLFSILTLVDQIQKSC